MICKFLFLDSTSWACNTREGSTTATVVGEFIAAAAFTTGSVQPHVTTAFVDVIIATSVAIAEWAAAKIAA